MKESTFVSADELVRLATEARERAYAPYSGFRVGAALLVADGRVYTGCNVENASYGLSMCAERTAVFKAVADGALAFTAVAVVADSAEPPSPCGACRQVLAEFGPATRVIIANLRGARREATVEELLPVSFSAAQLGDARR